MAFNFNWSPLIADTERARDMLTTALNKSPKPPIIVDDITVNELNLGSTPPELEILEIGDLAEDRFRGIFKMRYNGDAYLTLRTRVQANPLNTYLSAKSSFASPETVAASSGLTIPLQISLSEIRLSGFVILVFSKQKGITTVFRNDPLESLKVSSTFDSIPFVRDYLQRTIESQLRVLFMEDLPSIIHRLSLRVFNPEAQAAENQEVKKDENTEIPVDPFANPPQQLSADSDSWSLDDPTRFSLHSQDEIYATFSQKNLLRLAALTESQRTLSLFTPSIRDTVFRAWAKGSERAEPTSGTSTPLHHRPTTLSKIQSSLGAQTPSAVSSVSSQTSDNGSLGSRPTLSSLGSAPTVYTLSSGKSRPHGQRKRKNRVVNLRKDRGNDNAGEGSSGSAPASSLSAFNDGASISSGYTGSAGQTNTSTSVGRNGSTSEPTSVSVNYEREGEVNTPERSPQKQKTVNFHSATHRAQQHDNQHEAEMLHDATAGGTIRQRQRPLTPRHSFPPHHPHHIEDDEEATPRASQVLPSRESQRDERRPHRDHQQQSHNKPQLGLQRSVSDLKLQNQHHHNHHNQNHNHNHNQPSLASPFGVSGSSDGSTGGILENAWMMKMQQDLARKIAEEKAKGNDFWRSPSSDSLIMGNMRNGGSNDDDDDHHHHHNRHHHHRQIDEAPPAYTS